MDRFEARRKIVEDLQALGLVERIEPYRHAVGVCYRCKTVVEPLVSKQWYLNVKPLAQVAVRAVRDKRINFIPRTWNKTYYHWMDHIRPWCISRQLWWGHRIPAWYCDADGSVHVSRDDLHACPKCGGVLRRDEDVLDTWFSSALWPFSTLGWPEQTPELERFYPTSVLVTGFDIIFFWVARMMMMGLKFMGEVPFGEVYIHGLVRDERGQKMSKSKGNVIDPLDLIEKYGADALRFALLASTVQGGDVKLGEGRVQGYRNFTTKLWNAARFCQLNECRLEPGFEPGGCRHIVNRWVLSKLARAAAETTAALEGYRFNEAAATLYRFTWDEFCDWYLELAKPQLSGDDSAVQNETRGTTGWVLAKLLHLLHPLTPFVTEELWDRLFGAPGGLLIGAPWPELGVELIDAEAEAELDWLIRAITAIRGARSELGVPPSAKLTLRVRDAGEITRARFERHREAIIRLTRLADIEPTGEAPPRGSVQILIDEATMVVPLAGVVDLEQERARLGRELAKTASELKRFEQKLANPSFLDRAPAEVVEEQRQRRDEADQIRQKLEAALARIAS
jgi:valyl-tRNA synthetase